MDGSGGADGSAGRSLGGGWSAAMWAAASSSNCINSVESLGARASWVLSMRCNTSMARQTACSAYCLAVRRRRWKAAPARRRRRRGVVTRRRMRTRSRRTSAASGGPWSVWASSCTSWAVNAGEYKSGAGVSVMEVGRGSVPVASRREQSGAGGAGGVTWESGEANAGSCTARGRSCCGAGPGAKWAAHRRSTPGAGAVGATGTC